MKTSVIKKPLVTEKTMQTGKTYVFEVEKEAKKGDIKQAVEQFYKVEVKSVRTVLAKGKKRFVGKKRVAKHMPDRKKAYVTLNKGEISELARS